MTRLFAVMLCAAGLGGCSNYSSLKDDGSFVATPAAQHNAALSQAADKFTSAATPGNSAYKIGPLDVIDVSVFQVRDLNKSVQVGDDGNINFPLVGALKASGKTAKELEIDLAKHLGAKYLQSPQVTVFVKDYNSQRVTLAGSVKQTGVFPLKGRTTLMQGLAQAGDVDRDVASGVVVIFRTINGTRSAAKFDFEDMQQGKIEDPELLAGDVIVVDTSPTKLLLHNVMTALPVAGAAQSFVPVK
jgi:polysaccharide export outer membrane protein